MSQDMKLERKKKTYSFANLLPGPLDNHTQGMAGLLVVEMGMLPI